MIKAKNAFNTVRAFIKREPALCAKIAAVAVLGCTVFAYMCCLSARDIVTVAYANGEYLGVVADGCNVYSAAAKANGDASLIAYPSPELPEITFDVRPVRSDDVEINEDMAYKLLYDEALSDREMMYALFIDGRFAAANADHGLLDEITSAIEDGVKENANGEVEITSDIRIKQLYCDRAYALESERIAAYLADGLHYQVVLESSDEVFEFFFEEQADQALAPNLSAPAGGDAFNAQLNEAVPTETVMTVTVTEEIPFNTVYEETDRLFKGSYEKKSDGAVGVKSVLLEITVVDGVEVSRRTIGEEILVQPVDKVVYAGKAELPSTSSTGSYIIPIEDGDYIITDRYGERELYGKWCYHNGIDLAADRGVKVMAADGGVVVRADYSDSYGKCVTIRHDNGHETLYAHLSSISVSEGDEVYQGQKIGEVGRTGIATGNHLHLELFVNDEKVDPEDYIDFD